jgi:hypothetical protein
MPRLARLYLLNLAPLATHEIDSAFWKEWEIFHLPGGLQLFLALNLLLLGLALGGLPAVMQGTRRGLWYSLGLSSAGLACFLIHGGFLLAGHPAFRTPVSLSIIGGTFGISLVQAALTIRSNADDQKRYVEFLLTQTEHCSGRFVNWYVSRDYDAYWNHVLKDSPNANLVRFWKDNGLYDGDGNPRPSLTSWRSVLALPRR